MKIKVMASYRIYHFGLKTSQIIRLGGEKVLEISLLGTGCMIPLYNRFLTAMLARHNGRMLLIDCGEGTQVSMRELGWGVINLDFILITHFHADHTAGIPGLLLSLSNYGKTDALTIVGPKGIKALVSSLRVIAPELVYPIDFIELPYGQNSQIDFKLGKFNISALPLNHTLPCFGYSVNIARTGKFDVNRAKEYGIPLEFWSKLQSGKEVGGFKPSMVLGPQRKGIKVSYITDTLPVATIPDFIMGSDLFICEGLHGDDDLKPKADHYCHMIFSDAAKLAKEGNVKELWLTHFSQALDSPEKYIPQITEIFKNSKAGFDRKTKILIFSE